MKRLVLLTLILVPGGFALMTLIAVFHEIRYRIEQRRRIRAAREVC